MGQTTDEAVNAVIGVSRYWAANGLSAEFDHFLHDGIEAAACSELYPTLTCWHGVSELQQRLLACAGLSSDWKTLLANRSAKLFELPIRLLQNRRRRILCFQSLWPRYSKLLKATANTFFFKDCEAADDFALIEGACERFISMRCDAIVLPAVTHFGRVMPYADIIELLMARGRVDIAVVDGAQEFGQLPLQVIRDAPIFYLTCSQKWLRAGLTSGIAFVSPQIDWKETIEAQVQLMQCRRVSS